MDTYKLEYPFASVVDPAKTISELPMIRPKAKHLDAMESAREKRGDMYATIVLIAGITGLPIKDVEELDLADFSAVSKVATDFLSKSMPDPEKPAG